MRPGSAVERLAEVWWDATADYWAGAPSRCRFWYGNTWSVRPAVTRHPADPDYYTTGRRVPVTWPDADPAPVVATVDPRPEGAPVDPSAVLKLQRAALAAGWATRTGYSRGLLRTRSIGVYKDVEIIGVWAAEYDETRWYAMHERTIGAATGWKWGAITLWRRGQPMVSGLKITELYERLFRA